MKILLRNNKDRNRINTYKNISSNVECIATIEKVVSVGKGLELVHNTNESQQELFHQYRELKGLVIAHSNEIFVTLLLYQHSEREQ